jgi:hypothetical protein
MNIKVGLVCSLTDEKAGFIDTCKDFNLDAIEKDKVDVIPTEEVVNSVARLNNGAQWFLWISGLSIINTLILFFGGSVSFIFGLGITQLIEGIFIVTNGELSLSAALISILISGVFAIIWSFAKQLSKPAFIIGIIVYSLDAVLLLIFQDWLSFGVHIYALVMIFKGYQSISTLKEGFISENEELN